jgi:hypothetical protein
MSGNQEADPRILVIDDDLDSDERAELLASLERALDDAEDGRGMDAWEYLERRRLMGATRR